MIDDKKSNIKMPHNLILEDRKSLSVSGVSDVDSFDEQNVIVYTDMGELTVRGRNLHINKLNIETGELVIDGEISSMIYTNNQSSNQGIFSKLFR